MGFGSGVAGYAAQLATADRLFRALFSESLIQSEAAFRPRIDLLSMPINAAGKTEVSHNWMGSVPKMKLWKGNREIGKLRTEGFVIKNNPYANAIEVKEDDIENDALGLYTPRIRDLAAEGVRFQYELLRDLLNAGFSDTGYDGAQFFDNTHPNNGGTAQDNYTDDVLDVDAYKAACVRLQQIEDEKGNPYWFEPTHLIAGPDLKWVVKDILEAERAASGATNTAASTAQGIIIPGITAGHWFVADLSRGQKPLILQTKRNIRPDSMIKEDSPNVFHEGIYYFGSTWKGGAGYGLWEMIQGSDGSGT